MENVKYDNVFDYLKSLDVRFNFRLKDTKERPDWGSRGKHNIYDVYIFRGQKRTIIEFTDSISDTQKGVIMSGDNADSVYDVVCCLMSDYDSAGYTYNDFCNEFGYDAYDISNYTGRPIKNKATNKTYQAVVRNGAKIDRLFSQDEIDTMREILNNY